MRLFLQFTSLIAPLLCLCLLPLSTAAQDWTPNKAVFADEAPAFLSVTEAYTPVVTLTQNALNINWQIADNYYLYQEKFAIALFREGQIDATAADYGEAIIKDDPYFGETPVYYNFANTALQTIGDTAFLLKLTAQGCADAGLCYPPNDWLFRANPANGSVTSISLDTWNAAKNSGVPAQRSKQSLWLMLLFALLGGAILNLMPCVFPVLGLKVLSFTQSGEGRAAAHGAVYSAGVVLSFVAAALVLIGLQSAGAAIGWGFQLQTPWFVALLSCVFFVLSLNLLGAFEITLLGSVPGQNLSQRSDYTGSFFTGVLATVIATPCTAPFMGTALGFAATQPPAAALAVFAALGIGMALPVFLLTLYPRALQSLPRSGVWMERLKQFLGFPLLATAIWLCWVIGRQTGADGMATTLLAWLILGLAIWLVGLGQTLPRLLAIVSLLFAIALLGSSALAPRDPNAERTSDNTLYYSQSLLNELRSSARPVFIDVTADWCITCKVNEKVALHTDAVRAAFADKNIAYLVADWTLYDENITALLSEYRRNGIPLYLLYLPGERKARVLPQILSENGILQTLELIK
ncbi:MAG: thiol:disulfide interchange protein [Bacteroidia bacterium]|jgi:thiol:disulfide interchange protein